MGGAGERSTGHSDGKNGSTHCLIVQRNARGRQNALDIMSLLTHQ